MEDIGLNRLVLAQLSKTKLCELNKKGGCVDPKCRFAHAERELRRAPDLAKTAICRAFTRGKCKNENCKYAHGEKELRVTPDVYKTQICNFFKYGTCKKGSKCRHAHGDRELREFMARALRNNGLDPDEFIDDVVPPRPPTTKEQMQTISLHSALVGSQDARADDDVRSGHFEVYEDPACREAALPMKVNIDGNRTTTPSLAVTPPGLDLANGEDWQLAKRAKLRELKLRELKMKARALQISDDVVSAVDDEHDPKEATINLIIRKMTQERCTRQERYKHLTLGGLKAMLRFRGVEAKLIEDLDAHDDPRGAAIDLIEEIASREAAKNFTRVVGLR